MLTNLSSSVRKTIYSELSYLHFHSDIIFDKKLITESHSFLSGLDKKCIDNRQFLLYSEGNFGFNRERKANLTKENCIMNENEYLISNYIGVNNFIDSIIECVDDILCNGIKHHLNKDYFVVNRNFFDTKHKRLLDSRFYKKDGSYITGFKMLEKIGIGECFNFCEIGKTSYGFRPNNTFQGSVFFLIRNKTKKFTKVKTENIKVERNIREKEIDFRKEGYYPKLTLYSKIINKISPKFEDKDILDFMDNYISKYKTMSKIVYYFGANGDFQFLEQDKREAIWNSIYTLYSDIHKLTNIRYPHRNKKTPNTIDYSPIFTIASTGRLFECNGIQGVSRLSKSLMFNKKEYYNYDFSNSQLNILNYFLHDMQIVLSNIMSKEDMRILENDGINKYLSRKENKQECADKLGISINSWKEIIFSYLYGSNIEYNNNNMFMIIRSYYKDNPSLVKVKEVELKKILDEFFSSIEVWRKYIRLYANKKFFKTKSELPQDFINSWNNNVPENGYYNNLVYVSPIFESCNKTSWLSAFILQGKESEIVFDIINELSHKIISYEFDGILSSKKLDQNIIDKVLKKHGISNLCLVEKFFYNSILEKIMQE